jgi:hypothetical protein
MALQTSGIISLSDVQGEFGGNNPASLSEYYGVDDGVPASGVISLADFYGTSAESGPGPDPTLPPRYTYVASMTVARDMLVTPGFPAADYDTFYYQNDKPESGPVEMGLLSSGYYRAVPPVGPSPYVGVSQNDFNRFAMQGVNGWDFQDYTNFELTITTVTGFASLFYVSNPIWSVYVRDTAQGRVTLPYLSGGNITGPGVDSWPYANKAQAIGQALASNIDGNGTCRIGISWVS